MKDGIILTRKAKEAFWVLQKWPMAPVLAFMDYDEPWSWGGPVSEVYQWLLLPMAYGSRALSKWAKKYHS